MVSCGVMVTGMKVEVGIKASMVLLCFKVRYCKSFGCPMVTVVAHRRLLSAYLFMIGFSHGDFGRCRQIFF